MKRKRGVMLLGMVLFLVVMISNFVVGVESPVPSGETVYGQLNTDVFWAWYIGCENLNSSTSFIRLKN
ncbi:hypothetical protein HYX13_01210 [Candidatus Woesearchaeota archaeon]|nr:hypothetical protein [Candidatus Woesearchaeota archaeon]